MSSVLYGCTILLSAFLLFWVQLLFARLLLPSLGGSPAVWTTCLFFFQAALLAGYGYAHLLRRAKPRVQLAVHTGLLLLPCLVLPIGVADRWLPAPGANQVLPLLFLLLVSIGLPFLVVSTTAPLLQSWFARLGQEQSRDPYPLYAASNLGSLLALVAYPFGLEPLLALGTQSRVWTGGYALLAVGVLACGALLWRAGPAAPLPEPEPQEAEGPPLQRSVKLRWLCRSFVPAGLLYGVTSVLTTDIAAVPLLWAAPLALYLLSFVLAFRGKHKVPRNLVAGLLPPLLLVAIVTSLLGFYRPPWLMLALHLVTFFGVAYLLHRDLAAERPPARDLTGYYLWIAGGGMLAGAFSALAAPLLFDSFLEYPLLLMAAGLLLLDTHPAKSRGAARWVMRSLVFSTGMLTAVLVSGFNTRDLAAHLPGYILVLPFLLAVAYGFSWGKLRALHGVAYLVMVGQCSLGPPAVAEARSFFGVHRVVKEEKRGFLHYYSGTTVHGRQHIDPARRREPVAYYDRAAPMGQVFTAWERPGARVAVLGLGVGGLSAYAKPGQRWRFYEIDPVVERLARTRFTFLKDAPEGCDEVVIGDARLSLAAEAGTHYDAIVLDVFTSGSVPVHLLTREAFGVYLDHLAPDGLLVAHVSSHFLDLQPLLAGLADAHGLSFLSQVQLDLSDSERDQGRSRSHVVVLARSPAPLAFLAKDPRWRPSSESSRVEPWSDDHAGLLRVLKLR